MRRLSRLPVTHHLGGSLLRGFPSESVRAAVRASRASDSADVRRSAAAPALAAVTGRGKRAGLAARSVEWSMGVAGRSRSRD